MKIKYNNKNYCFSKCAKDKFQTWVISPLTVVLVAVLVFSAFAILGFITEGILVTFFDMNAFYKPFQWVAVGIGAAALIFLLLLAIFLALDIIESTIKMSKRIYNTINDPYEKHYKKSCHLFEECE